MAFGINNRDLIGYLFKPHLVLAEIKRNQLKKKIGDDNFSIGLFTSVQDSSIGRFVRLGEYVTIVQSEIGDYSYVNSGSKLVNIQVGKFCSIGSEVLMGIGKHPTDLASTHPAFYSKGKAFKTFSDRNYFQEYSDIVIGHDVWIGSRTIIMGGVKIGNGAIVAAGAVVTKDVEPYSIVGGVPARHIKYRIQKENISSLQKTEWWNQSDDWFLENFELFHNVESLIAHFQELK